MQFIALAFISLCHSLPLAIWFAAFLGGIVDLLSDDPMGVHALNYTITTALLHRFRRHLLWETPLHLSVFTAAFSAVSTFLHLLLLFLFDRRVPFDGKWILTDLLGMPIVDAFVALVLFSLPLLLFKTLRRLWVLFWLRKNSHSLT